MESTTTDSDLADFKPSRKRRAKTSKKNEKRFCTVPMAEVEACKKPVVVKNTEKSTLWAVGVFSSWVEERNEHNQEKCPMEVLCMGDDKLLCYWLCAFVKETRRADGQRYTPRSIQMLLSGLQRFINSRKEPSEALVKLTADNPNYRELHNVLDNLYRELHFSGIGAQRKQAEVISRDEESILWEKGALSVDTPNSLLNTVFYYNGLNFVLGPAYIQLHIHTMVCI